MSFHNLGLRMGSVSSTVFAAQGVFLLGNAFYSILFPSSVAHFEGSSLTGTPEGAVQCIGLTSLALGTYYLISTYQRDTLIMVSSIPSRLVAAWVMYRNGGNWRPVAAFETSMAVLAGAALLWDRYM
ncbi:uncharacterized protein BO95DRAFT_442362 [Aspergillus brunneoviolaceus CBS 621.78]|uniref:Uncharacterized protein n=2 Tax=Aspergillus TaxID=5052 RepID=A0A8G1W261_9EURO|nr:hypothetical protein BO95DRAFT_442362 [Aspergillus brunneoviolaceus CBS 621.78]XP_040804141.1 uncharacterized protein BO72DRAFT_445543 [Aspergillus fijiensis CBS 313.89]RAH46290.1 hypothetical protein BO95DRAFT_442362 [Aspergillus brunneoviolaceus CBS 621.78]RAK80131.1 hypothetical protein BO72DRAFT_445543 [Aspergillus fijiensis CBS 313.89]